MALFEIDNGRLIPAQFGRKAQSSISDSTLGIVRSQILQVIDKSLMPVAWLGIEDIYKILPSDMPHSVDNQKRLISFDLSGQLVIVDVVNVLNSKVLADALTFLSRVSNLAWKEIADFYPGGVNSFASAWMDFREKKPVNVASSPRLILVANEIHSSIRPALDILLESGLAVYELDVRTMSNGRMFLDVVQLSAVTHKASLEKMLSVGSNINALGTNGLTISDNPTSANNNVVAENMDNKVISDTSNVAVKNSRKMNRGSVQKFVEQNVFPSGNFSNPKTIKSMTKGKPAPVQFDSQGLAVISALSGEEEISLYLPAICKGGVFGFLRNGEIHAINAVFDDANKVYLALSEYFMVTLDSRIHPNSGWDAIKLGSVSGPSITEAIREINYKGTLNI